MLDDYIYEPRVSRISGKQHNVKRRCVSSVVSGRRGEGGGEGTTPSRDIGVIIWRKGRLSLSWQLTLNRIIHPPAQPRCHVRHSIYIYIVFTCQLECCCNKSSRTSYQFLLLLGCKRVVSQIRNCVSLGFFRLHELCPVDFSEIHEFCLVDFPELYEFCPVNVFWIHELRSDEKNVYVQI